jgi:hypothetical protein
VNILDSQTNFPASSKEVSRFNGDRMRIRRYNWLADDRNWKVSRRFHSNRFPTANRFLASIDQLFKVNVQ